LHEICRYKKVILLTVTPFNNRPADIYALLKLFIIPKNQNPKVDTHHREEETDELVYKLYDLSEEEIKIIESSI
jgi:hypothetical protein